MHPSNENAPLLYWDAYAIPEFPEQPLYLAASEEGLCRITWPSESFEILTKWAVKHYPRHTLARAPEKLAEVRHQLDEYFAGERKRFELALDMKGTDFQKSVWQALTRIPFGETHSYSDVAAAVGNTKAVRAVGTANGANPIPIVVPCHRVIGKDAALTGFRGGLKMKQQLLHLEGFEAFTGKGHERFQF